MLYTRFSCLFGVCLFLFVCELFGYLGFFVVWLLMSFDSLFVVGFVIFYFVDFYYCAYVLMFTYGFVWFGLFAFAVDSGG